MKEKVIEGKIKEYLSLNNVYWFKVHGSAYMVPGIPDIVACWQGLFVGIEVKRLGAKKEQSEHQKIHERNIVKAGGIYILADSLEDVMEVIK